MSRSIPSDRPSARPSTRNVRREPVDSAPSLRPMTEDVPSSERPKPPRDMTKVLAALRVGLGLAMVVGIGTGVVWGARKYVRSSPRFAVREIVATGGKRRSTDDLSNLAGIAKGQNVFSLDLEGARARLASDPWIEHAEVTRQLPGTISIQVSEREAAGLVALTGEAGGYLVTRDGAIIKRVEAGDPVDVQAITGVPLKTLLEDREAATRMIRQALDLGYEYERTPLAQRSALQEVHVEPSGDNTLIVGKSAVSLRMGAPPYRRKLEQAVRIVAELDRRGAKADVIMLDDEARPERVVVRMR